MQSLDRSVQPEPEALPPYGSALLRRCIGWLSWGPAVLGLPAMALAAAGWPLGSVLKLAPVAVAERAASKVLQTQADHRLARAMREMAHTQAWVAIAPDVLSLAVLALLQAMTPTRMVGALLGLGCIVIHVTLGGISYRGLRRLSRGEPDPTFDSRT